MIVGKGFYMNNYNKIGLLSGSSVKLIACVFMAIDHIGLMLFPKYELFRILGRIAFPLFAFFIAEGCKYSKNKAKRFGLLFSIGILYLILYLIYDGELYGNIFLTFSVSVAVIYAMQMCKKYIFNEFKLYKVALSVLFIAFLLIALFILFENMYFEYGYSGMLIPVFVSLFDLRGIQAPKRLLRLDNQFVKLICLSVGLMILGFDGRLGDIQFYALLSIPILLFYNGLPGKRNMKYLFYIFYPAHLAIIEAIVIIVSKS